MTKRAIYKQSRKALRAIRAAYDERGHIYDYNVVDLLTDLRHYCDARGFDFANLDRQAREHHIEEKKGG